MYTEDEIKELLDVFFNWRALLAETHGISEANKFVEPGKEYVQQLLEAEKTKSQHLIDTIDKSLQSLDNFGMPK
jgi:hypothetical protein